MKTRNLKELKPTIQRWIDGTASISDISDILRITIGKLDMILCITELAYPSGRPWEGLTAQDIFDTLSWYYLGLVLNRTKAIAMQERKTVEEPDEPRLKL